MKHLLITIAAVVLEGCGNPDGALLDAANKGNIEVAPSPAPLLHPRF